MCEGVFVCVGVGLGVGMGVLGGGGVDVWVVMGLWGCVVVDASGW